jgi:hypothetical protein
MASFIFIYNKLFLILITYTTHNQGAGCLETKKQIAFKQIQQETSKTSIKYISNTQMTTSNSCLKC